MALSKRALTAALFAEKVVAVAEKLGTMGGDNDYPGDVLHRALRDAGMRPISSGHYGVVLVIPESGDILKVCACHKDGYPTYAQWAQRNPGPCTPDIFWSVRVSEDLFLCAMPRYQRLDDGQRAAVMRLRNGEDLGALTEEVCRVRHELGHLAREDMHAGNFMYCPRTEEYIITDPFADLYWPQGAAEGCITGTRWAPQMQEQMGLDLDRPALAPDLVAPVNRAKPPVNRAKPLDEWCPELATVRVRHSLAAKPFRPQEPRPFNPFAWDNGNFGRFAEFHDMILPGDVCKINLA